MQHIAIRWRRHGKHDEDDDVDDAAMSLADKLLLRPRVRATGDYDGNSISPASTS